MVVLGGHGEEVCWKQLLANRQLYEAKAEVDADRKHLRDVFVSADKMEDGFNNLHADLPLQSGALGTDQEEEIVDTRTHNEFEGCLGLPSFKRSSEGNRTEPHRTASH